MTARKTAVTVAAALALGSMSLGASPARATSFAPDPNAFEPTSFTVGTAPRGIALVTGALPGLVANSGDGTVTVFTPCQPKSCAPSAVRPVAVGAAPTSVVMTSDASAAYVTLAGADAVAVLTVATGSFTPVLAATVPVGSRPADIALTPDGTRAYVTNSGGNSVSVVDTASRTVVTTVPVGAQPWGIAVAPSGATAYVANSAGNSVSVIDTAANVVVASIPVGIGPGDLTLDPSGATLLVTNNGGNSVSVVDTASRTVVATVPVGVQPWGVAVTADGGHAFVANYGDGTVSAIRLATRSVVATVRVGGNPFAMTAWPASVGSGSAAYATDAGGRSVATIPLTARVPSVTWSSRARTARGVVPFVAGVEYGIRAASKAKVRNGTCRPGRGGSQVSCTVRLSKGTWRVSVTTRLPWQPTAGGNQNKKFRF